MNDREFVRDYFAGRHFSSSPRCEEVKVRVGGIRVVKFVIRRTNFTGRVVRESGTCLTEKAAWASAARRIREQQAKGKEHGNGTT